MKTLRRLFQGIRRYWFGYSEPPRLPESEFTKDNYWGGWGRPGQ